MQHMLAPRAWPPRGTRLPQFHTTLAVARHIESKIIVSSLLVVLAGERASFATTLAAQVCHSLLEVRIQVLWHLVCII